MTSTELKIGLTNSSRPSSRVLKPPGGGHSNIFAEPDVAVNAPRPKYNQQNSSNLNACIGSTDPNLVVEKLREDMGHSKQQPTDFDKSKDATELKSNAKGSGTTINGDGGDEAPRGRIPPGGFSSGGFW